MKSKKVIAFLTSAILILTLLSPAYATTDESNASSSYAFSEYDVFLAAQEMSVGELMDSGFSEAQAVSLKNSSFENLLLERASLSSAQLQNLGYTEDQIETLKNFENGVVAYSELDLYAIAGTCTGEIKCNSASSTHITFVYRWEWDHCPVVTLTDSMAVRWCAVGNDGDQLDVNLEYEDGTVDYFLDGKLYRVQSFDPVPSLVFTTLKYDFNILYSHMNEWAKRGEILVMLDKDSGITRDIYYVNIAGLYGHTLVNIGAPGISISASGVGFSFTGGLNTDNIAGAKKRIYSDGTTVQLF